MSASVTDRSDITRSAGGARGGTARSAGGARGGTARAGRAATVPAQRGASGLLPGREPRGAAARAYARRDDRTRRLAGSRAERAVASGRPRFVLLMMVLLAAGLVATLWLSTAAAADSYRLEDARLAARQMTEQSERLHLEVASMSSPTSLAERAAGLGMVPVQDSARLVVDPGGEVDVVGTPRAAVAPAPPPPPCPPAGEPGAPTGAGAPPAEGAPAAEGGPAAPECPSSDAGAAPVGPPAAEADGADGAEPGARAARAAEQVADGGPAAEMVDGAQPVDGAVAAATAAGTG
ncbi:MAG: hypothetical protein ACT4RN_16380 [Pseudonocardia sp.]